jgi:lactoylglutathione lyase
MAAIVHTKPFLDVGLFTNRGDAMRRFYGETLGLPVLDTVPIEPGYTLHRYDAHGSALKLNVLDEHLGDRRTGYARVLWPDPGVRNVERFVDPDGNEIERVPPGHLGVHQIGIVYKVPSLDVARSFAADALGGRRLDLDRFQVGDTVLLFELDRRAERSGPLESLGFTYTTLHVTDTEAAHAHLLRHGCTEAIPPTPFGDITVYSFVRDPMGNWIEISRRADLAGGAPAPTSPRAVLGQAEIRAIRRRP